MSMDEMACNMPANLEGEASLTILQNKTMLCYCLIYCRYPNHFPRFCMNFVRFMFSNSTNVLHDVVIITGEMINLAMQSLDIFIAWMY